MSRLAVFGLCLLGWLAAMPVQAGERLMLWEASKGAQTVYLFGSIHVCRASCFPLSRSVTRRLEDSEALVLELDPQRTEAQSGLLAAGLYPPGESLQDKMSRSDWQLLERSLAALGLPAAAVGQFRPWLLSLTMSLQAAARAGYEVTQGIDIWVLARAREQGKPVLELESVERQIAAVAAGSEREQLAALRLLAGQIDSGRVEGLFEEMRQAWQKGDVAQLERVVREGSPPDSSLTHELLDRRNVEMVTTLQTRLLPSRKKLFVVVGAAHLLGPQGIPALLAKQGFRLRQVQDGE